MSVDQHKPQRLSGLRAMRDALPGLSKPSGKDAVRTRLCDIGDVFRRSVVMELPDGWAEKIAGSLSQEDVKAGCEVDARSLRETLTLAADAAMEAFLAEDPREKAEWFQTASQALIERDRLQSLARALELFAVSNDGLIQVADGLERALTELDRELKAKVRYFLSLNGWRRQERDALDDNERPAAWWFSARAECDDLLPLIAGKNSNSAHLETCADCQTDLERTQSAAAAPIHLTSQIAFELDLGLLPKKVAARYEAHADICPPCKAVLKAIAAGERAIEELDETQPKPQRPSARRRDEEVLEDAREYRVLLRRREGKLKLMLAAREGHTLATASLYVVNRKHALAPKALAQGLEFDLGPEAEADGLQVTLKFKLGSVAESFERSFTL